MKECSITPESQDQSSRRCHSVCLCICLSHWGLRCMRLTSDCEVSQSLSYLLCVRETYIGAWVKESDARESNQMVVNQAKLTLRAMQSSKQWTSEPKCKEKKFNFKEKKKEKSLVLDDHLDDHFNAIASLIILELNQNKQNSAQTLSPFSLLH